jgi:L-histidine N-alpha-methyltransferase
MTRTCCSQEKSAGLTSPGTPSGPEITRLRTPEEDLEDMAAEVRDGLEATPPALPSKYFYDARGSALFERITALPEYYLTRVEEEIHRRAAADIVDRARPRELVELGSGMGAKTRRLLDAMAARDEGLRSCILLDVDEAALRSSLATLTAAYPDLQARGIVGDFLRDIPAVGRGDGGRMIGFLGGTIGNLDPTRVPAFFKAAASVLDPGDTFLLGADLVKDIRRLEAAYNDRAGVTAEFNGNLLRVINARLGADFEVAAFAHVAFYDPSRQWIEMRLRAIRRTAVHIPQAGVERTFARGDEIRTEISCKYTRERLEGLLAGTGLAVEAWYTDADAQFAVTLLRRVN